VLGGVVGMIPREFPHTPEGAKNSRFDTGAFSGACVDEYVIAAVFKCESRSPATRSALDVVGLEIFVSVSVRTPISSATAVVAKIDRSLCHLAGCGVVTRQRK
jgi:hypothetical protein